MRRSILKNGILPVVVALILPVLTLLAQTPKIEQLRNDLKLHLQEDTLRVNRLNELAFELRNKIPAEARSLFQEALDVSKKLQYDFGEASALIGLGFHYRFRGQNSLAFTYTKDALKKFILANDTILQITCMYNLAQINSSQGEVAQSISNSLDALRLAEKIKSSKWVILINTQLGGIFIWLKETAKGKTYLTTALKLAESTGDQDGIAHCRGGLGRIAEEEADWEEALEQYHKGFLFALEEPDTGDQILFTLATAGVYANLKRYDSVFPSVFNTQKLINQKGFPGFSPWADAILARTYLEIGKTDSAIFHGLRCLRAAEDRGPRNSNRTINRLLAQAYSQKGLYKDAFSCQQAYINYKDSLNENEAVRRIAAIQFTYDLDKKQSEIDLLAKNEQLVRERNSEQQKLLWSSWAGLILLVAMLFFIWRNNRQKQKANKELEKTLSDLKATQAQLIQSEKMASLGELTAGIAHEIQNPLNFVNNFSEINAELIDEVQQAIDKGKSEEVKTVLNDIKENEQKIIFHGKRADSIVKGMLLHSRSSSGVKEPTNINALADEYLRLAYHGLRAKDKTFNATMQTDYDEHIGMINIVPQDIGRVILNLITNAFYAVTEKSAEARAAGNNDYEPTVSVSTKKRNGWIEIKVSDNGKGIPQKVLDKIFQPFFTTKPTGKGTGLGLSMSYDIVSMGHGGELKTESKEGEGAAFIISLPNS